MSIETGPQAEAESEFSGQYVDLSNDLDLRQFGTVRETMAAEATVEALKSRIVDLRKRAAEVEAKLGAEESDLFKRALTVELNDIRTRIRDYERGIAQASDQA